MHLVRLVPLLGNNEMTSYFITPEVYYNFVTLRGENVCWLSSEMTPAQQFEATHYINKFSYGETGKAVYASACRLEREPLNHASNEPMNIEYKLYFGLNRPNGPVITHAEFNDFCEVCIDDHFEGYSLTSGEGVWKGEREDCVVFTVLGTSEDAAKVREIANDYKFCFDQESVLYTRRRLDEVEFI